MSRNQILALKEIKNILEPDLLQTKTRELFELGNALIEENIEEIQEHLKNALDSGATREEVFLLLSLLMGDGPSLQSIMALFKALSYEENNRASHISIIEDVRE